MNGEQIIDEIIKGSLFTAKCVHDAEHGCLVVWSSGAAEQLEAMANNHLNEQLAQARGEARGWKSDCDQMCIKMDALRAELATARAECERLRAENAELKLKVKELTDKWMNSKPW